MVVLKGGREGPEAKWEDETRWSTHTHTHSHTSGHACLRAHMRVGTRTPARLHAHVHTHSAWAPRWGPPDWFKPRAVTRDPLSVHRASTFKGELRGVEALTQPWPGTQRPSATGQPAGTSAWSWAPSHQHKTRGRVCLWTTHAHPALLHPPALSLARGRGQVPGAEKASAQRPRLPKGLLKDPHWGPSEPTPPPFPSPHLAASPAALSPVHSAHEWPRHLGTWPDFCGAETQEGGRSECGKGGQKSKP